MNSSDFFTFLVTSLICIIPIIFSMVILVAAIVAAVFLIKRSNEQQRQSEKAINQMIINIPEDKQMIFMMQYNNSKKNPTTAVLLALFLGGLGAHKFYMGETGIGIVYLVFSWTYIPAIIGFIEAFTITGTVAKYNEKKASELMAIFGGYRGSGMYPHLP